MRGNRSISHFQEVISKAKKEGASLGGIERLKEPVSLKTSWSHNSSSDCLSGVVQCGIKKHSSYLSTLVGVQQNLNLTDTVRLFLPGL